MTTPVDQAAEAAEREKFESWAAPILGDNPTWRESGDCELAWQAWQVRAELALPLEVAAPVGDVSVLSYLDALEDDAAVHIYPGDLYKCAMRECTVKVFSVRVGDTYGNKSVPLFSRAQIVEALAASRAPVASVARPVQPAEPAELSSECLDCGGTGMRDSGGFQPWGEAISIPCECGAPVAQPVQPAPVDAAAREYLQPADLGDLMRFQETTSDDEGYDIGKPAIKRLAELGAVQSHGFGKYSLTEFGSYVLDHMFGQNPALPLITNSDRDAHTQAVIADAKDAKP